MVISPMRALRYDNSPKQRCGYLPSLRAPLPQEGPQMKELVTLLGVGPWELEISDSGR